MSRIVDNLLAYRILYMLVQPFEDTDAFKNGIIDKNGDVIVDVNNLKSEKQKNSYTYLHRLVFNIKRIINKLPGGDSKLKNIVSALFLFKECYERGIESVDGLYEEKLNDHDSIVHTWVRQFLTVEDLINTTGSMVSTDVSFPIATVTKRTKKLQ